MSNIYLPPGADGIIMLAEAASRADLDGRSMTISTCRGPRGEYVQFKVGEDAWSPPFYQ